MLFLHPAVFLMALLGTFSSFGNEDNDLPPLNRRLAFPHIFEENNFNQVRPFSPPLPQQSFFDGRQLGPEDQELLQEFMNLAQGAQIPFQNQREEHALQK